MYCIYMYIYVYTIIISYLCNPEICVIWPKKGNFKCIYEFYLCVALHGGIAI